MPDPTKQRLSEDQIQLLVLGKGNCIASDRITVDGEAVGFMYREEPSFDGDSGWRFLAGDEDEAYMAEPSNLGAYNVNTIANYDRSIIPLLDAPPQSAFAREDGEWVEVPFDVLED